MLHDEISAAHYPKFGWWSFNDWPTHLIFKFIICGQASVTFAAKFTRILFGMKFAEKRLAHDLENPRTIAPPNHRSSCSANLVNPTVPEARRCSANKSAVNSDNGLGAGCQYQGIPSHPSPFPSGSDNSSRIKTMRLRCRPEPRGLFYTTRFSILGPFHRSKGTVDLWWKGAKDH